MHGTCGQYSTQVITLKAIFFLIQVYMHHFVTTKNNNEYINKYIIRKDTFKYIYIFIYLYGLYIYILVWFKIIFSPIVYIHPLEGLYIYTYVYICMLESLEMHM